MATVIRCPHCLDSSILIPDEVYALVDLKEIEIDVTDCDSDRMIFSLDISGEVSKRECLQCHKVFYL